jgi:hypothetical protein
MVLPNGAKATGLRLANWTMLLPAVPLVAGALAVLLPGLFDGTNWATMG